MLSTIDRDIHLRRTDKTSADKVGSSGAVSIAIDHATPTVRHTHFRAHRTQVVNASGAGDCMVAGIVTSLIRYGHMHQDCYSTYVALEYR